MAFSIRNLSVLAYANGFTLWHYKSAGDEWSEIASPDYFAEASDMMDAGNMIMVSAPKRGGIIAVQYQDGRAITAPVT